MDRRTSITLLRHGRLHEVGLGDLVDSFLPAGPGTTPPHSLQVALGLSPRHRPITNPVTETTKDPAPDVMLRLAVADHPPLMVRPSQRVYLLAGGKMTTQRAEKVHPGDQLASFPPHPIVSTERSVAHLRGVEITAIEQVPPEGKFVYTLQVAQPLPGFIGNGDLFLHE